VCTRMHNIENARLPNVQLVVDGRTLLYTPDKHTKMVLAPSLLCTQVYQRLVYLCSCFFFLDIIISNDRH